MSRRTTLTRPAVRRFSRRYVPLPAPSYSSPTTRVRWPPSILSGSCCCPTAMRTCGTRTMRSWSPWPEARPRCSDQAVARIRRLLRSGTFRRCVRAVELRIDLGVLVIALLGAALRTALDRHPGGLPAGQDDQPHQCPRGEDPPLEGIGQV